LLEFPIALEDELPTGDGPNDRAVIDDVSRAKFEALWTYVLLHNTRNGSMTTLNVRASRGSSGSREAIPAKLAALTRFLEEVEHADVAPMTIDDAGDFWRARLSTTIDATYDDKAGYDGTITFGPTTAHGLGLDFGDRIETFTCDGCGPFRLEGKRIVLTSAPPPKTKAHFTATVR
jgi:hypothetical protein